MAEEISERQRQVYEVLKKAVQRRANNRALFFKPYPKQLEFYTLKDGQGNPADERLLMAGNQQGKSEAGAFEAYCHLTGKYPDWWKGHRIDHPPRAWLSGESSLAVRDILQTKLIGPPGIPDEYGTGYIPKEDLLDYSLARGVTDAIDTFMVQHYQPDGKGGWIKDGISRATFKSYEQGRQKWQGEPVDFLWFDEEPPQDIFSEGKARFTATHGFCYMTFTPLKGMSNVVLEFLSEQTDPNASRAFVTMTIDDALHITKEERAKVIAKYQPWEREARTLGIPMLGSGRIFLTPEAAFAEPPLTYIPPHWVKLWGTDFGIDHPFAAALLLWDRDNDVIHVHHTIRMANTLPIQHAAAMKPLGESVPVAWPQDGTQRQTDGEPLAAHYKRHGLRMLGGPAMWPQGGNSTEAGIMEMQERLETGRLKVAAQLSEFFEEYRLYHREKGLIVKVKDDILSAIRTGIMAKRYAQAVQLGRTYAPPGRGGDPGIAKDVDFDYFG